MTPTAKPRRARTWPGYIWAALAVLTFSGWFVVTRFTMSHSLRVWDVLALRFGGGAIVLLPVLIASRRRITLRVAREGLIFAVLWGGPFVFLVAWGLKLTSAAQASSTVPTLMPVFAAGLAWVALGERPTRARWAGFAAIFAGLVVLVTSGLGPPGPGWLEGTVGLVFAALMWAVYTVRFRRSGLTAAEAAALICAWTAVLFVPVYWAAGLSHLNEASTSELWFQLLYQGVLVSALAVIAFNEAVRYLGAGAAAAISAMVPVSATCIAAVVLDEMPAPAGLVAICVIAGGVVLAARPARTVVVAADLAPRT